MVRRSSANIGEARNKKMESASASAAQPQLSRPCRPFTWHRSAEWARSCQDCAGAETEWFALREEWRAVIQRSTLNAQRSTLNAQRSTSNVQRPTHRRIAASTLQPGGVRERERTN